MHREAKKILCSWFVMPFQHLGGEHVNAYSLLYSGEYAKREESFMGRSKSRNLLATSCCEGVRILRQTMSVLCRHLQHRHRVILTCDTTRDRKGDREKTKDEPSLLFDGQTKYVWSMVDDNGRDGPTVGVFHGWKLFNELRTYTAIGPVSLPTCSFVFTFVGAFRRRRRTRFTVCLHRTKPCQPWPFLLLVFFARGTTKRSTNTWATHPNGPEPVKRQQLASCRTTIDVCTVQ